MIKTPIRTTPSNNTHQHDDTAKVGFGFWIYLMTDCVLFASLFATYAVLKNGIWDGPGSAELFNLPYVWAQTLLLLASSFTCAMAILAARAQDRASVLRWLSLTFLLGIGFLGMEINEFRMLVQEGNSWQRSGFLSAFFTLVGTHGLHITVGLIWLADLFVRIARKGLNAITLKRLTLFSMFWHFLDIIWIFIFTIVYLLGVA